MKTTKHIFLLLVFSCFIKVLAQERPPINVYTPEMYGGGAQNWSISQSKDRTIYVANNRGLLEYNGSKWTLYESPNGTIVRSVKVIDSLIYTANYQDFGYWKRDNFGVLNYTSLSKQLNISFLEDEEFWNIKALDNWILFQSSNRIHIYNKQSKSHSIIKSKTVFSRLYKVNGNFYFQNHNNGLYKIENGKDVLISDDDIVKYNFIVGMFRYNDELLLLTQDNGFFRFVEGQWLPWRIPANEVLKDVSVFNSIQLNNNEDFVLGTISNGIIHIDKDGNIKHTIAQANGLSNNTVLSLFEDMDGNLWLGLDNGINSINATSPHRVYFDKNGFIGSVYVSMVHNDMLYLGTNQGLFCRPLKSNADFNFIKGTQGQVWFLGIVKNTLFCGHNLGTFQVRGKEASLIADVIGTWQVKPVVGHDYLLLQGNYNGLNVLENKNGKWQFRNKIEGFNVSSRYFEFSNSNEVYVSHEYKGLFKLKLNNELTRAVSVTKEEIVQNKLYSSLVKYQNNLLYSSKNGVYKYNEKTAQFEKDLLLSGLISEEEFTSAKLVVECKTDKLWSFNANGINYVTSSKLSGDRKIESVPFPVEIRKDVTGFESITHIKDGQFLLGSRTGYTILDLNKSVDHDHKININQIALIKQKSQDSLTLMDLRSFASLKSKDNSLQFSYSISEFLKNQKPMYRYKLEGRYDSWSDWTTKGSVLFENLPYGAYTFSVIGRVGNQNTVNTASYAFEINRPWFLSNMAIASYILAVLLFSVFMHNVYKRYYRKQRERLMQKTTREFELKELENKQQLMRYRNEKLREDIEHKNRELGISTMSLIKKNEFLNTIKKELEDVGDPKNLKRVIKIIDRNLNNNDDWNLFQEAFNNADKDFLKKIKSVHPNLTANDLRLCAYLRLNLSSKEIAPLLNISPRSVEVKRYRLRKKMELPHEASLSDYILEI